MGVQHRFSTLAAVDITYFHDDGKDRYIVVTPPPFPPVFANIEQYRIQGVETTLSLYPLENLSFFTGLTYPGYRSIRSALCAEDNGQRGNESSILQCVQPES